MTQTILIVGDRVVPVEEMSRYTLSWRNGRPFLTCDGLPVEKAWALHAGASTDAQHLRSRWQIPQCEEREDEEEGKIQQEVA